LVVEGLFMMDLRKRLNYIAILFHFHGQKIFKGMI